MEELKNELVDIRVFDVARGVSRRFECDRETLISEMRYFKAYFERSPHRRSVKVQCDIPIFDWLIRYATKKDNPPLLSVKNVVSILVSSQFLLMSKLTKEAQQFLCSNYEEVFALPLDLTCLDNATIAALSEAIPLWRLGCLPKGNSEFVEKLCRMKVEQVLRKYELLECARCELFFTHTQACILHCHLAKPEIDFRGKACRRHMPNKTVDFVKQRIGPTRSEKHSRLPWKSLLWWLVGIVHTVRCKRCHRDVRLSHLNHPCQHDFNLPVKPRIPGNLNSPGFYDTFSTTTPRHRDTTIPETAELKQLKNQFLQHGLFVKEVESRMKEIQRHCPTLHSEAPVEKPASFTSTNAQEIKRKEDPETGSLSSASSSSAHSYEWTPALQREEEEAAMLELKLRLLAQRKES